MKVSIGNLSAWFIIIGTLCFSMFIPWLVYKSITNNSEYDYLLLFSILVGTLLSIAHYILAFFVKCPECSKLLTVRGFKEVKPNTHDSGLEVAFIWFTNKVYCMHCGEKVDKNGI